ncbi:RNA 2',3'-cyclic phosphodiesterase [Salisediminibacterium beveridgei]|uniref:2'-5' RNA ligase n=1 Tax=Salisediminibacterium beveridgei TaxID=632773 RepID=A0A1D7QSZ3_9BACI|nr:RNA 2',3'-cyclic phosphodiesterase [Salisediminibacterium beveridgei]AOM82119.1 2'-5' RNA ligase [Salisediminibacterium beveridgei]
MEPHYFIGIPLHEDLQQETVTWHRRLQADELFKRVTHPEDLHLTLLFFGGFSPMHVERIWERMKQAVLPIPLALTFRRLNHFGDAIQPRVVYVEPDHQEALFELKRIIDQEAEKENFPVSSKVFTPHVTIMKKWKNREVTMPDCHLFPQELASPVAVLADRICLYRIHPDQKPSYEIVDEIRESR